ncbi:serine acetyltransferase [Pandoraea cepalis]|uniref:Serine acetyltransferase n=1 Tax=Pandoraea cepalis TaxID=2508294 RepID=A0A5E4XM87_9BURK|nr:serine acetyltransferase [Pandoraea cepalis]
MQTPGYRRNGLARHPIIDDNVMICAGATIFSRLTVGEGSVIDGNVRLKQDMLPYSNITQAKARSESSMTPVLVVSNTARANAGNVRAEGGGWSVRTAPSRLSG